MYEGEIVSLIGSNGAGKTTTMKTIHGLVKLGMAQSPEGCRGGRVFPRMSVRMDQKAGLMSGGEQQVLAIGRALASRPSVVLLDEPAAGMNPVFLPHVWVHAADRPGSGGHGAGNVSLVMVMVISVPMSRAGWLTHRW